MIRGIDRSLSGPILQSAAKSIRRNLPTVLLKRLPVKTLVVSTAMIALLFPSTVLAEDLSFGGPLCQGSCPLLYFYSISQVGGIGR